MNLGLAMPVLGPVPAARVGTRHVRLFLLGLLVVAAAAGCGSGGGHCNACAHITFLTAHTRGGWTVWGEY